MTGTDIRETLRVIADDLDVPSVDPLVFDGRVRTARRRRTAVRAGVAAVVAASVALVAIGVTTRSTSPRDDVQPGEDSSRATDMSWDNDDIVVVANGHLVLVRPGDPPRVVNTDIEAELVLEQEGPFVDFVDPADEVHRVVLNSAGEVFNRDEQTYGPVVHAWAARGGGAIAYTSAAGATFLRLIGEDEPVRLPLDAAPDVAVVGEYGDGVVLFASAAGRRLSITSPADGSTTAVDAIAPITDIDVGGPTIAVQTTEGVEIRDLDGDLRYPATGTGNGALSDDGHWYASVPGRSDREDGPTPTLRMVNATSGDVEELLVPGANPVTDVWWQDEDRFFLIAGEQPRQLFECTVSDWSCDPAYLNDTSGTMRLPQD